MRFDITAKIGFPAAPPVEGHFASIAVLHDLGYLDRDGDYLRSLERAGFHVVEGAPDRHLDVATGFRGVFSNGVGRDAEMLLSALASEGFEGILSAKSDGRSWYLSGGRSVTLTSDTRLCA